MQTELSLRIKPELDDLYKSVGKVKKSLEIDLGEGIAKLSIRLSLMSLRIEMHNCDYQDM